MPISNCWDICQKRQTELLLEIVPIKGSTRRLNRLFPSKQSYIVTKPNAHM